MSTDRSTRPALSLRKKIAFAVVATTVGLGVMEAVLATIGVTTLAKSGDPFVGFDQKPLFDTDVGSARLIIRTRPQKLPWFNEQTFLKQKPVDGLRIFCLGGSTTYGRPYRDETSFCGQLRHLLRTALPDRTVEVINAGGVSYASYRVERLCQEILQFKPDAVVVYTGHNEFLEHRTYAPLREMSDWRRNATSWLGQTHIYSAMHQLWQRPLNASQLDGEVATMLDGVVGLDAYQRDDELHQQVLTHFQWNLSSIAQRTRAAGVPMILVTPASNIAEVSPFKSLCSANSEAATSQRAWARELMARGDYGRASAELEAAVDDDNRCADLHFELGRCWLQLGQVKKAQLHLQRALEEDVCPVRAPHAFVNAVRQMADHWPHVGLVDFERMLSNDSQQQFGHRCLGDAYFLDHVHPKIQWHGHLAVAIGKSLVSRLPLPITSDQLDEHAADMRTWADGQLTPKLKNEGLRNLAKVYNWAGKHEQAGRLAVQASAALPQDAESHLLAAPFLFEKGEVEAALEHAKLAVKYRPDLPDAHRLLGQLLAEQQAWDEATTSFIHWTRLTPNDGEAWALLGSVNFQQQRWGQASSNLERAESLGYKTRDTQFQIATALHHSGKVADAESRYRELLKHDDSGVDAMFNLALLLLETNRQQEAAQLLRRVVASTEDAEAKHLLESIEAK